MKNALLAISVLVAFAHAQSLESKLSEKIANFLARNEQQAQRPIEIDAALLMTAEGADAMIYERNNLYSWELLREYYFDFDVDTTGATHGIYLDYNPNSTLSRSFPAVFSLWHSAPYASFEPYRDSFITVSKALAGSSYIEVSNKPDTLFENIPGWDYSYQYRSGASNLFVKSHILSLKGVAFNVFFLTFKTDFDSGLSRLWYALVLAGLDFNTGTAVAEEKHFENLKSFLLLQNYPNPFNASTVIPYKVSRRALVSMDIFNINGQRLDRIFHKLHEPGEYRVQWHPIYGSGVYFCKISDGLNTSTQRMILVK